MALCGNFAVIICVRTGHNKHCWQPTLVSAKATRFTVIRVMMILINHPGTLGFCSRLLIDLPPTFPVETWEHVVFIKGCGRQFHIHPVSFTVLQTHSTWTFIAFRLGSNQQPKYALYVFCCLRAPGWSYRITQKHSDAHMHQCRSTPLRLWIQFRGCETFGGNFSAHTLWRVIFLPL